MATDVGDANYSMVFQQKKLPPLVGSALKTRGALQRIQQPAGVLIALLALGVRTQPVA
jgi:hypothetical protein